MTNDLDTIRYFLSRALDQDGGPATGDDNRAMIQAFEQLSNRIKTLESVAVELGLKGGKAS